MTDENQVETPASDAPPNPPEVETEVETKVDKGQESSPDVTDTDEIAHKAKGVGRRIDELTRNWREAERREAALLGMLQQQQTSAPEAQTAAPKTLADFNYDEVKYQEWLFGIAEQRAVNVARRELQEQSQRDAQHRRNQSFAQRESNYSKNAADYFEVTRSADLVISVPMAEAIAESDDGPALAYHLGKNPEIAARIAELSPLAAARELGRIEGRLADERAKPKPAPVSKAPPPAPKIEGADASTIAVKPTDPESDKALSDAEWMRQRNKQEQRKRAKN